MINNKQIEDFRKKECYCVEISEQKVCKKCGQELPEWKNNRCLICGILDNLIKFANKTK